MLHASAWPERHDGAALDGPGKIVQMRFLIWVAVNALALAAATWLLEASGRGHRGPAASTLLLVGPSSGWSHVVRPIVKLLSLPFIIVTLGLLIL